MSILSVKATSWSPARAQCNLRRPGEFEQLGIERMNLSLDETLQVLVLNVKANLSID